MRANLVGVRMGTQALPAGLPPRAPVELWRPALRDFAPAPAAMLKSEPTPSGPEGGMARLFIVVALATLPMGFGGSAWAGLSGAIPGSNPGTIRGRIAGTIGGSLPGTLGSGAPATYTILGPIPGAIPSAATAPNGAPQTIPGMLPQTTPETATPRD
jgi:hypothetical protein